MTTFQFAIICGNDDLLQLFFKEFESDIEFMEDCVLGTIENDVNPEDLLGKCFGERKNPSTYLFCFRLFPSK